MDLQITYYPGVQNISADMLFRYGQSTEGGNAVVARNSLRDVRIAQLVKTWLSMVAPMLITSIVVRLPRLDLNVEMSWYHSLVQSVG